jgi:microcystin-dependent protein
MAISQNTALFSILGTIYGGDGVQTFALPNLQGRAPMHWGTVSGLPSTVVGETMGQASVTLLTSNLPPHSHAAYGQQIGTGTTRSPTPDANSFLSNCTAGNQLYDSTTPVVNAQFAPNAISPSGGSLPHDNMQPYLALNFCIAQYGVYPSRP